jgi:hypothetical protein
MQPSYTYGNNTGTFLDSKYVDPNYLFSRESNFFHGLFSHTVSTQSTNIYYSLLFMLSVFFIAVIFYSLIRVLEIRKKEHKHLEHEIAEYAHHKAELDKKRSEEERVSHNDRWVKTLNYLFSDNPGDWKLAVIEADSMLEVLLDNLGFQGESLGEKLKAADQNKFPSLASAWEIHGIRNRIAHEGASFELSLHEAKRVIALYERIFRQYGFI